MTSLVATPSAAGVVLHPRRRWAERLFGYDVFISFALGDPPRGSLAYAADLARRLQANDLTVFFSEQELLYGEPLSEALDTALRRSAMLVVIVNEATLADPRWVRTEVERFVSARPHRPIVPVCLDDTLDRYARQPPAQDWHRFAQRKFHSEPLAGSAGASDAVVQSITAGVGRLRANRLWRIAVGTVGTVLLGLTALAGGLKAQADQSRDSAERQRQAALVRRVVAEQDNGWFARASARVQAETAMPATFRQNVDLSVYETGTALDIGDLPPEVDYFDINELRLAGPPGARYLLMHGWYSGASSYGLQAPQRFRQCGRSTTMPDMSISDDARFVALHENGEVALRATPECSARDATLDALQHDIAQHAARTGTTPTNVQALNGQRVLAAWTDGTVVRFAPGEAARTIARIRSGVLLLLADPAGERVATLGRDRAMRLFHANGRTAAPPFRFDADGLAAPASEAWREFLRAALGAGDRVRSFSVARDDGAQAGVLSVHAEADHIRLSLWMAGLDEPLLAARAWRDEAGDCPRLSILTPTTLVDRATDPRCAGGDRTVVKQDLELPRTTTATGLRNSPYTSGVFCGNPGDLVLGSEDGALSWMRHVRPRSDADEHRVEFEHVERSWSDTVTTLQCEAGTEVYAGARVAGVKRFRKPWRVDERRSPGQVLGEIAQWPTEDLQVSVDTEAGAAVLRVELETGDMLLERDGQPVWQRRLASPIPYRTGREEDLVRTVTVDAQRGRVWALTSRGRLWLLDIASGAQVAQLATAFHAPGAALRVDLQAPVLGPDGGIAFRYREQGSVYEVAVQPFAQPRRQ